MKKMSEIKKLISEKKLSNDDLYNLIAKFGEESDDEELEDESETQHDSKDAGDADGTDAKKDQSEKKDGKGKPQLTMTDLQKMIEDTISKTLEKKGVSKSKAPTPAPKKAAQEMKGGIDFGEFGLIPTPAEIKK